MTPRPSPNLPALLALLALAGCGTPQLVAQGSLSVVDVSPSDGAEAVPADAAQAVCFSQPLLAADATVARFWVADETGARAPELQVGLADGDGSCVRLAHGPLRPGVGAVIHVEKGVRAAQGTAALPVEVESRFKTAP